MNKEFFTLPEDFNIGTSDFCVHFYSNNKSSVKNKVIFTQNMFCLLLHGTKEVQTAEGKEVVNSNEVLILTSGSTLMSESVADTGKYEAILIFFSNKILTDFCVKYSLTFDKKIQGNSILKVDRDDFLNNYCESLKLLKDSVGSPIHELKVQEILCYISAKYPETFYQLLARALADKARIKLRQVVELHSNKGLTVEELAFLCNMSISTFKRHFAEVYQITPQRYFTRIRMEQAKKLLSLQKRPSEISAGLGYENLSAFSTEFKKYAGISPKQFQNQMSSL